MNPIRWPLYLQTLIALLLGITFGLLFETQAAALGGVAKFIIEVIKMAAIPLLFLAITDAILNSELRGKSIAWLFLVATINSLVAIFIALGISNLFQPGKHLSKALLTQLSPDARKLTAIADLTPGKIVALFFTSPMIAAILIAILLAVGFLVFETKLPARRGEKVRSLTRLGLDGWMKVIGYVMRLVPIAVFAAVARVISEHAFTFLQGLTAYFLACCGGMLLHIILCYQTWILFIARISLRRFWREAREPVVQSFGINSSLATLPFTLKALDRLGVTPSSARLSACVGTNFNNDGILLYEVVAVLFLAQAYGIHVPLWQQMTTALICVIATIGVGGIPEAGLISLTLVLAAAHLPSDGILLLITVDWFIARLRSVTNVLGDMAVAIAIDALTQARPVLSPLGKRM